MTAFARSSDCRELRRGAFFDHLAAVHEDNLVRDVARKAEFVRDDDRGAAADRGTEPTVWSAPFNSDGSRVVTAPDQTARTWNVHFATAPVKDLINEV